jgi:hypothetical protein
MRRELRWLIVSLLVFIIACALWLLIDGRSENQTTKSSAPLSSVRNVNPNQAEMTVGPTDRNGETDSTLPIRLTSIVAKLRQEGGPIQKAWADAIEAGWEDLPSAISIISKAFPSEQQQEKIADLVGILGGERLSILSDSLNFLTDPRQRRSAVSQVSSIWATKDIKSLVRFAEESLPGELRNAGLFSAATRLSAGFQHFDAGFVIQNMPYSAQRDNAISNLAVMWSRSDPTQALHWAESLDLPDERTVARRKIVAQMSASLPLNDLKDFADMAQDLETRKLLLMAATEKIVATDVHTAREWVEQHLPELGEAMKAKVAVQWCLTDPNWATNYVMGISDDAQRRWAVAEIGKTLTSHSPQAAVEWLERLPIEARTEQVGNVVRAWFQFDSIQVSTWIEGLEKSPYRDHALAALAQSVAATDRETGRRLSARISDDRLRNATREWIDSLR